MARLKQYKAVWFPLPNDEDSAEIEVIYLNQGKHAALKQKISPMIAKARPKKGEKESTIEMTMDMSAVRTRELTAVAYIKNWKNFFDTDDEDLKCNEKNKKLFSCEDGFMDFLLECIEKVNKECGPTAEEEVPN